MKKLFNREIRGRRERDWGFEVKKMGAKRYGADILSA
jgi:hypothetical protein